MKKFKVIEEGRLDASQLSQIRGGRLVCQPIYHQGTGPGDPSTCPSRYRSCLAGSGHISCSGGYSGTPGSAGLVTDETIIVP